jgi:hypothetical protein
LTVIAFASRQWRQCRKTFEKKENKNTLSDRSL